MARVPPGRKIDLREDFDPGFSGGGWTKQAANQRLEEGIKALAEWQDKLYADDTYAVLIVLQALDAAGKDGTIKHVMSGVNPQGVTVTSFKAPSSEELSHDYLWRNIKALPERGHIGIFNRSYYEEVLVTRVHPELLEKQNLPPHPDNEGLWEQRFEEINNFEKYLVNNGIIVLKFFLNVSKEEQKRRFMERLTLAEKNWKFSAADIREREYWDAYLDAYEDLFNHTSTPWAPWYIIPADRKWGTHLAVAAIIYNTLADLKVDYPTVTEEARQELRLARMMLEDEENEVEPDDGGKKRKKKNRRG
jgi:PPK2 family polyphosphate:nucleotide phosphotransferase